MATFTKAVLSGSTDGQPVKIAATAIGSGTTIHTAGASGIEEVYLWVTNTDSSPRTLTIGWGGTTDPDSLICKTVSLPANSGPIPIVMGVAIQNAGVIKAAASAANVLLITGYTNKIV